MLGPVLVNGTEGLSPRERIVVSVLALWRGDVVAPDRLADALWGERPPSTWPKQVQACVVNIRRAIGPSAVETTSAGYRLAIGRDELDAARFDQLVARGRDLASTGEPERAASSFVKALGQWNGPAYVSLGDWAPAFSEVVRLGEVRRAAEEDLLDVRLACGEHREVAAEAEVLVGAEPLRERRWAILALAQYRCGRQADALRTLQRARHTLVAQLGLDPTRELTELETAILRQDESLTAIADAGPVSAQCPYKGLAAYDVDDHASFFGRDQEVAECVERLRESSLLVVSGPSGCGKSSLVRAGIVPSLIHGGRSVVIIVPGVDPLGAIDSTLAGTREHPVLVVDQFEELFTLDTPVETAHEFCRRVAEHAGTRAPVIIVVRADHIAGLTAHTELAALAERGLHLVGALSGDALRESIEGPARQAGLRVERGLVDVLVHDIGADAGALPLLSHALVETWRRRDRNVLTVEGYESSGGIRGAVARSADRLYESLAVDERDVVRSVMLRLVAPTLDGEPSRCRVSSRALREDPTRDRVVTRLVRARLVTAEADTVEIAHEALARAWPRLQAWLDDDTAGQRILRHLSAAADGWVSLGRPDSELYRGARLEAAIEYRQDARPDLTTAEIEFLEESGRRAETEARALAARVRRDARQNRRLRWLLAAAVGLVAVSLVAGLLAWRGRSEARDQRDAASAAREDAEVASLVNRSLALRATDRDVAALLAVEAVQRWPDDARARSALFGTFTAAGGFLGHHYIYGADYLAGALVPGTTTAIVGIDATRLVAVDLETGEIDERFPAPPAGAIDSVIRVSDDGRRVAQLLSVQRDEPCRDLEATGAAEGCSALVVYDVVTGEPVLGPLSPPIWAADVAINDDGSLVAVAGGYDGVVVVYRTSDGEQVGVLAGLPRPETATLNRDTAAVAFGPDGALYVGSLAGPIRVADPVTLEVITTVDAPPFSSYQAIVVAGDLVVAAGDRALVGADVTEGGVRWTADIRGTHPEPCPWFTASAAAGRLYCGNYFGVITERDLETGEPTGVTLDPQLGAVGSLSISTDGDELVAFGAGSGAISRWRLDGSGAITSHVAEGYALTDGWNPAGGIAMLVGRRSPETTLWDDFDDFALWDPDADQLIDDLDFGRLAVGVGWVGPHHVSGFFPDDGTVSVYDIRTSSPFDGGPDVTCDRALVSAGAQRTYCLQDPSETVVTFDATTGARLDGTIHVDGIPVWASATRDGTTVVVTAFGPDGGVTTVHDGDTGEQIGPSLSGPGVSSVSLDGVLMAATGGDIARYDLATLERIADLPGARGEVNTLQFSRDGTVLLATSLDQTVSVYDVASGTRLGDPIASAAPFIYPGFLRPDGGAVAVTDAHGRGDLGPRPRSHGRRRLRARRPKPHPQRVADLPRRSRRLPPDLPAVRITAHTGSIPVPESMHTTRNHDARRRGLANGGTMHRHTALLITSVIALSVAGASHVGATTPPGAVIPDGTYSRTATRAEGEELGLDEGLLDAVLGADGEMPVILEIEGDLWWFSVANDAGVFELGDLGTLTYEDDDRVVMVSESTGSPGGTMVLEWTFDGEVLEMHALDNGDEPVAHAQFIVGGIYLIESSADATTEAPDTVTLRFANIVDDLPVQIVAWLVEVQRLSGGSIEFEFVNDYGAGATSGAESATLADIGSGTIDIGWVGARAFPAFDALLAPMLVDSYELEGAVFDAGIPTRMLAELGAPGIVGLGVLPGPLRRIVGVDHPFVGPADFDGQVIAGDISQLSQDTMRALGATPVAGAQGQGLEGLDGLQAHFAAVAGNGYHQEAAAVTANLNLWPRPLAVVINADVLDGLTPSQQAALTDAAAPAVAPSLDASRGEDAFVADTLCNGPIQVVEASADDLAAMRAAVQPVYDDLASDAAVAAYLDEIEALKNELGTPPDTLTCTDADEND